jgi:hypothetical protein
MANINHNTLSDPYIHESKGVSTALAGQIYVANGSGSGNWVENSRIVNGYLTFSTGSPYSIAATTTDAVINPTFTIGTNNGFTGLSSPNARIRYDAAESIAAIIDIRFSLSQASGSAKDIQLSVYKNSVELSGTRNIISTTNAQYHLSSLLGVTQLNTNDYIEVFVKSSANATVLFAGGSICISGIAV